MTRGSNAWINARCARLGCRWVIMAFTPFALRRDFDAGEHVGRIGLRGVIAAAAKELVDGAVPGGEEPVVAAGAEHRVAAVAAVQAVAAAAAIEQVVAVITVEAV